MLVTVEQVASALQGSAVVVLAVVVVTVVVVAAVVVTVVEVVSVVASTQPSGLVAVQTFKLVL